MVTCDELTDQISSATQEVAATFTIEQRDCVNNKGKLRSMQDKLATEREEVERRFAVATDSVNTNVSSTLCPQDNMIRPLPS